MSLGLLVTAPGIVKMSPLTLWSDYMTWKMLSLTVWFLVEEVVAVVAGWIPCLKAPFEQLLEKLGLPLYQARDHGVSLRGPGRQLGSVRVA